MKELKRKVVLVTGASTGLGLALVKELLKTDRYHVVATARRLSLKRFSQEGLRDSENLWIRPLDILSLNERQKVLEEIDTILGGVDVLVNNAAYCLRAVVEHVNDVDRLNQIDTNFRSPLALIRGVLPSMRNKRDGHIINISSVGGMMAMPTMSIYSASKFALEGATEALWYEVKPWDIKVTLVEPGFINSDGFRKVKLTKHSKYSFSDRTEPYHFHYKCMASFIEKIMVKSPVTTDNVAKKIVKVIEEKKPPLRLLATPDAILFDLLRRFLPRRIYHWCLYKLLPGVKQWGHCGSHENDQLKKLNNRLQVNHNAEYYQYKKLNQDRTIASM